MIEGYRTDRTKSGPILNLFSEAVISETGIHRDARVLIVGAGPTGLTLASRCLQLGLPVRIVDRKPGPTTTSNAIGLQYRVSEILAMLGVVDRFIEESHSPTAVKIHAADRELLSLRFDVSEGLCGQEAFRPRPLMIPQSRTESILLDHLQSLGGKVQWNTEYLDCSVDGDRVQARLQSAEGQRESWQGSWLVSCEGAHSRIRHEAGIDFAGKTYPMAFVLADIAVRQGIEDLENHVWMHREGAIALLPLSQAGIWRLFVEVAPDLVSRDLTSDQIWSEAQELLLERVPIARSFKVDKVIWASQFRIHCRLVNRYRSGPIFLAGDAAHVQSYTGGQGITTGMQDAFNLAWKLARVARGAPDALLDTYKRSVSRRRKPCSELPIESPSCWFRVISSHG
jgi:2-polyprenyl-6-methoxyphenol hydroxylase-like FAD-dependent oxidoreductase